jgi:hypothetical protein
LWVTGCLYMCSWQISGLPNIIGRKERSLWFSSPWTF